MGISQVRLGNLAGLTSGCISDFELGKREPWPRARKALARALSITEAELFPTLEGGLTMQDNGRLTYSIPEACVLLGISRNLGYELAKRGELPGLIRLGEKRLVVSRQAIERLLRGDGKPEVQNVPSA